MTILITRSESQSTALCEALAKRQRQTVCFPTIEIETLESELPPLEAVDLAIFTSQHAATPAVVSALSSQSMPVYAIGPTTAAALTPIGDNLVTPDEYSSEGLLSLPELMEVEGSQALIFSGEGGRSVLFNTLTARGADVTKIACYRRRCPTVNMTPIVKAWQDARVDTIVAYSVDAITHLLQLLPKAQHPWAFSQRVCVVSRRIARMAQGTGFQSVLIAQDPTDRAILAALEFSEKSDGERASGPTADTDAPGV